MNYQLFKAMSLTCINYNSIFRLIIYKYCGSFNWPDGLMSCWTNVLLDYMTVGPMGCRNNGLSPIIPPPPSRQLPTVRKTWTIYIICWSYVGQEFEVGRSSESETYINDSPNPLYKLVGRTLFIVWTGTLWSVAGSPT